MNRPVFNKFSEGDPVEDYNRRMREWLVYLEARDRRCTILEHRMNEENYAKALHSTREKNYELSRSMKVLRSQIKTMFKEGNNAN
jgi:hypothetical protein